MTLSAVENGCATTISKVDIYLVDDDPLVRRSLIRLLESAGHRVQAFAEPHRFLDRFLSEPAPVVILDIWMEPTGIELLAHIYARLPQTRLIFVTGHQDQAIATTVKQAGAFAFLNKPLDSKLFLNAVQSALDGPPAPAP
jgi:two-component system, LuxR family, response regulator FixJ